MKCSSSVCELFELASGNTSVKFNILRLAGISAVHSWTVDASGVRQTVRMPLFPCLAPRVYVECPRCHTPWAFITIERVDTQCSFCPLCRYLWDSVRQDRPDESAEEKETGRRQDGSHLARASQ
jgi:hypothetical protein